MMTSIMNVLRVTFFNDSNQKESLLRHNGMLFFLQGTQCVNHYGDDEARGIG